MIENLLMQINIWAVLAAAISAFVLGGIWYSKALFGNVWCREAGINPTNCQGKHPALVFFLAFLLSLLAAFVFACALGSKPDYRLAILIGFGTGLGFVATSFGINYLFANRSFKLFLIDAGYHIAQFTLYGVILGAWH